MANGPGPVVSKKKVGISISLAVVVFLALAALAVFGYCVLTSQPSQPVAQAATSGGAPAGPTGPIIGKPTFEQLAQKSPEEIRDYMKSNFKYRYISNEERRTRLYTSPTPEEILADGEGDYSDFAHFFASVLVEKGCWQWKNTRVVMFEVLHNGQHEWDSREVVVFYDPRNGQNYYLVPEPPDFPIYKIGATDDPIPLEEQRLGEKISKGSVSTNKYCR